MKATPLHSIPMKGDSGEEIRLLQSRLKELGHDPGALDGVFGSKTASAVSSLQKANGLPGSGVIGPKTMDILGFRQDYSGLVTVDIGKKDRRLHPKLRRLLESEVFPGNNIPECFRRRQLQDCVVHVARAFERLHIREQGGNNRGQKVGWIQSIIGADSEVGTGDAWCMSAVQCVIALIEDFFQVESPVSASEHCVTVWNAAKLIKGLASTSAELGTAWIARHGNTSSGHTGLVVGFESMTARPMMKTIEGNTGDQSMRDGDGLYFRTRDERKNGDLVSLGWVRLYPNNVVPEK